MSLGLLWTLSPSCQYRPLRREACHRNGLECIRKTAVGGNGMLHPLVLHPPALDAEHVRDASVAIAAESTRESHDITSERPLVTRHFPRPALGRAWLPEHPARSPLRRPELLTYTHHTTSSALGAQKFPLAASSRISLSSEQRLHRSCSLRSSGPAAGQRTGPVSRACRSLDAHFTTSYISLAMSILISVRGSCISSRVVDPSAARRAP